MYQIGVDIGGTNIKVGLVNETMELVQTCSVRFPHDGARSVVKTIEEAVDFLLRQQAIARKDVESVGIVVPGSIDQKGERVIDAYNLGFHDVPLKALAQEAFGEIPVYLANDANGAALAELYAGAFRGCKTAVLFTLGTGLGGGIILNGHMFNGGMNQGVELGHMYLVNGGEHCTCGNDGCMEAYCAASALARDGKRAMEQHPESLIAARAGGSPENEDAKLVIDCAKEGDKRQRLCSMNIPTACPPPAPLFIICLTRRLLPSAAAYAARENSFLPRCAKRRRANASIRRTESSSRQSSATTRA